MPSDQFFGDATAASLLHGAPDIAFLDGMHQFEFLVRDFYNAEKLCSKNSLIIMHDCLPLNEEMAHRDIITSVEIGKNSKFPNYWTGDVWKIIPILKKYRPDLRIEYVDSPPTGLVIVYHLDSASTVLRDSYHEILSEFSESGNSLAEIEKLYDSITIVSTSKWRRPAFEAAS